MNTPRHTEEVTENVEPTPPQAVPRKKGKRMGRPKGSKNKVKAAVALDQNGDLQGTRSTAIYRKFQRSWVKPQFAITRGEATALLTRFLRSKKGRSVLHQVICDGFRGIDRLSDDQLAKYLQNSNLLSRYPHEVVIGK